MVRVPHKFSSPFQISIEIEPPPPPFFHFPRMFYRIFLLFSVLMFVVRKMGFADLLTLFVCFCARCVRVCLSIFVPILPHLSLSYLICLSHFISLYIYRDGMHRDVHSLRSSNALQKAPDARVFIGGRMVRKRAMVHTTQPHKQTHTHTSSQSSPSQDMHPGIPAADFSSAPSSLASLLPPTRLAQRAAKNMMSMPQVIDVYKWIYTGIL
jgi:hypothetical protein